MMSLKRSHLRNEKTPAGPNGHQGLLKIARAIATLDGAMSLADHGPVRSHWLAVSERLRADSTAAPNYRPDVVSLTVRNAAMQALSVRETANLSRCLFAVAFSPR